MWIAEGVEVRREIDMGALAPMFESASYQTRSLNRAFFEIRLDVDEAAAVVAEEGDLLARLEMTGGDWASIVQLLDQRFEGGGETSALDAGVAGAVAALSAGGACTISSCNGGTLGDGHAEDLPTILFVCQVDAATTVLTAAEAADCGLINRYGSLELFADDLRRMNRFARELLALLRS